MKNRLMTAALILLMVIASSCSKEEPGLKDAFEGDFLIGTAVNATQVFGKDEKAQAFIAKQFNSVTPEDAMKWERIHPEPGRYLSLIHISEPTRLGMISYAVFCLK